MSEYNIISTVQINIHAKGCKFIDLPLCVERREGRKIIFWAMFVVRKLPKNFWSEPKLNPTLEFAILVCNVLSKHRQTEIYFTQMSRIHARYKQGHKHREK